MIGKVEWHHAVAGLDGAVPVVMTLGDDRVFRSEQMPSYAEALTEQCREEHGGPADGAYGVRFLHELAEKHNGTVTIEKKPEPEPPAGLVL